MDTHYICTLADSTCMLRSIDKTILQLPSCKLNDQKCELVLEWLLRTIKVGLTHNMEVCEDTVGPVLIARL